MKKIIIFLLFALFFSFGHKAKAEPCVDSDGGINYAVQGKTSGNHGDICFNEKNWAPEAKYDKNGLIEMYCDNSDPKHPKTLTKEISCKNGCAKGACINCPAGDCANEKMDCKINSDCLSGYRCDIYFSDGKCKIPSNPYYNKCLDTDGGYNPYSAGTVQYVGRDNSRSEAIDKCIGDTMLMEAVCDFNGYAYNGQIYTCQKDETCIKSACINKKDLKSSSVEEIANELSQKKFDKILKNIGEIKSAEKEKEISEKYFKNEVGKEFLTFFVAYGVDNYTKKMGKTERLATVLSYKDAFNNFPKTKEELTDLIRIAKDEEPKKVSSKAENFAQQTFKKIYSRKVNLKNYFEKKAFLIMAYGLRQNSYTRNLDSEKKAIKKFATIYKKQPKSTQDWNVTRAIAYLDKQTDK